MTPDEIDRLAGRITHDLARLGFARLTFVPLDIDGDIRALDVLSNNVDITRITSEADYDRQHAVWQALMASNPDPLAAGTALSVEMHCIKVTAQTRRTGLVMPGI